MAEGFTFNGIHSSTFGLSVLSKEDPVLPPIKDYKEEIPGMDGAWDFGCDYGPRPLAYVIAFKKDSRPDIRSAIRQIAAWLNPKAGSKPLIDDEEPDKYYMARVTGNIPLEHLMNTYREVTVNFIAYDPMAMNDWITWDQIVDSGAFVINNPGTYEMAPVITITALDGGMPGDVNLTGGYDPAEAVVDTITDPVITLGGKTIQYAGVIALNKSLIIDCFKKQASYDGLNAATAISGSFPVLRPGNNILTVTDSTSTNGARVRVQYRGRWL
ncbi:distal tail protein Dit [Candidatus Formimonas warabiya]|uniref:Phage tail protein n=1 Tax=Formimonas warabiya TaxID=1761012 RepID=A0A3G1KP32_FORW1|nr:distal tail protein Dit [Candidatus Formimonas warabiya]ATW24180.1 hypothetical protein DCMF_04720 [Candidatus Formimonas warabiya]